jgi:Domain of unknown function (DUF5655)
MAKDYGEMEREFIAGLKEDTGRDLAEWMDAIGAQAFTNKNDAIDWLRGHGFVFNWASWLERIHANGGRPIYADRPTPVPTKKAAASAKPAAVPRAPAPIAPAAEPPAPAQGDARLEELIAAAKGYQPLYRLLASEIAKALPGARLSAVPPYISIGRPAEFALIETSARGLRLALDLGDRPFELPLAPAKLTGAPRRLTHMVVLDDARNIDARLMELIKTADSRVNT